MKNKFAKYFTEAPPFLKIFGLLDLYYDDENEFFVCEYKPNEDLTHSNGTIVQGGFITGMLDSTMAQFLIFKSKATMSPLTLNINVKFLLPCRPSKVKVIASIEREGKSIIFTNAKMFQNKELIATASSINKLIPNTNN